MQEKEHFLCYFHHRHLNFRLSEVEALASLDPECSTTSAPAVEWGRPAGGCSMSPFWPVALPSEAAAQRLLLRSLLVKSFLELWGEGETWEELAAALVAFPAHRRSRWSGSATSLKVLVEGWGRSVPLAEQVALIERLEFLDFQGPIRLKDPEVTFRLIMCQRAAANNGLPDTVPDRLYFGREVRAPSPRGALLVRYALARRVYLGPTSMDAEMAFLMCNQARVRRGSFVFDPFVGTGSILVAAAHHRAFTFGADIDPRVIIKGKLDAAGQAVNVWSNFAAYGLAPPVGLVRADASRLPLRPGLGDLFDAMICDPPYGVRAGGRKSVPRPGLIVRDRATHIPSTGAYTLGECLLDLVDMAAQLLRVGGRLVFFMPAAPGAYHAEHMPTHPALRLVSNSEQALTTRYSRRLITLEKVHGYDAKAAAQHRLLEGGKVCSVDRVAELVWEDRRHNTTGVSGEDTLLKARYRSKVV